MSKTNLTSATSRDQETGFTMSEALHLPTGATYTAYIQNDAAYWMLDAVRETTHGRKA